jgi:hypothetical protein
MKKQLIAAAVATSVSAIAMADISITGGMKANYTYTDYGTATVADKNQFKHETDLAINGKSGDTNVVIKMSVTDQTTGDTSGASGKGDPDSTNAIEDVYMTTNVGGIDVKAGQWDNGNNYLRESSRNGGKVEASTTIGGMKVLYGNNNGNNAEYITLSGDVAGVAASYKKTDSGDEYKVSTKVAGIGATYHAINSDTANSDRNSIELTGSAGGVDITLVKAEAETATCLEGDTWLGDFEDSTYTCDSTNATDNVMELSKGQDITGIRLATSLAGNKVQFANIQVDDVASEDTSINKIIVTRPLASGATLEVTYTDLADDSSNDDDYESLDIELAVKF